MRVSLFVPCFVDAIYPNAAMAAARIIERLGHEVDYPEKQTCCGQPPFNTGMWEEAREVARHQIEAFRNCEQVVSISGSCGAMIKVFYPELFKGDSMEKEARELSAKVHEFSDFLVNILKVEDVGAEFPGKVTFHDGCHGLRELGIKEAPRILLSNVRGLELVEMNETETCCGFGGMFSVKFPMISTAMGEGKCESVLATGADVVVSNDASCLMHIGGMLERSGKPKQCLHLAEVLDGGGS